ncbi:unnamed protein product [Menidia menidia]|uniref:(Atlantic silverside) hypothetical protein n=1 Tax=Menidia menidia TaxID=238744 RepID=A0A8S4ADG9_9TELE|nr:unnamed protein product [Menidia menidia]
MKVTVTFGHTGVVVPCRDGWTVRDLIQQATQRYRKLLEQEGHFLVRTHHVEYCDGGILDPDDILTDLVEDKDKVRTCLLMQCPPDWGLDLMVSLNEPAPALRALTVPPPIWVETLPLSRWELRSPTLPTPSSSDPLRQSGWQCTHRHREEFSGGTNCPLTCPLSTPRWGGFVEHEGCVASSLRGELGDGEGRREMGRTQAEGNGKLKEA